MFKKLFFLFSFMLFLLIASNTHAETVTLTPDADTYIQGATAHGELPYMYLYTSNSAAGYLRFNLAAENVVSVQNATLKLRVSGNAPRNDNVVAARFALYGLKNVAGNTPQDWDEATLSGSNAGVEIATPANLVNVTDMDGDIEGITETIVQAAGTNYWDPGAITITISGTALASFIQSRIDDDGLVTFILAFHDSAAGRGYGIASKENATVEFHPVLELDAVVGARTQATKPNPPNKAQEVVLDTILSWFPGESANTHNVFFGTDEASVTNATITEPLGTTLYQGLDVNSVALDRLEYSTTYYWRVDEVNIPSNPGTYTGTVWSFTTELEGYPLEPAQIVNVTASDNSVYPEEQEPNMTCDGSGLDVNDMHSNELATMWLGYGDEPGQVWIQYEFDKIYKLHDMLVWNYNELPPGYTYGAKDVNIIYSEDGVTWKALGDTVEFNRASGDASCAANTAIDFDGAIAKYVKLTFWSSWEDGVYTGGLSEVRFSAMPTRVSTPTPVNAAANVSVDAALSWKAGRGVVEHHLYMGIDVNAVTEGTASKVVLQDASYEPVLELARTYYWKVDEVNMAEEYTTWDGPVWSFSTVTSFVVENFEVGYDDTDANAVWNTWIDGYGNESVNGALMGYEFPGPYLSTTNQNGGHSAPIRYNNTTAGYSEVKAQVLDLPIGRTDWTLGSPATLVLWVYGNVANNAATDRLYVKIGSAKVLFPGNISQPRWMQFNVPLSTAGINPANVSSITIGIEKTGATGGTGTVLIDNLRLYREAPELPLEEIWIEAESGTLTTNYQKLSELTDASGGQYIGKPDGSGNTIVPPDPNTQAAYSVILSGGVYSINVRIRSVGTEASGDSCYVRIPTATAITTTAGAAVTLEPTGSTMETGWVNSNNLVSSTTTWIWDTIKSDPNPGDPDVYWTLPAGTHTITIANREDGLMIDAILIRKVSN